LKFLCENCKAKYQIGDEKVAGKTVRMKCRRCGHLIEVSASVTETSVARAPDAPPEASAAADAAPSSVSREKPSAVPAASAPHAGDEAEGDESTMIMSSPPVSLRPQARVGEAAAKLAPRPGASSAATPLRSVGAPRAGGPALRAVPSPRPAPVGAARASAAAAAPLSTPAPTSAEPGIRALDVPLGIVAKPADAKSAGGVAGAFQRALAQPPATAGRGSTSEDWYVGIGGVPLGPIRLAVIREKAAAGAVDGNSLVWREGFDEWQPLKNFPELLEIVTEAQNTRASRRPSGIVAEKPSALPSSPSAVPPATSVAAPRPSAITPEPASSQVPVPPPSSTSPGASAAVAPVAAFSPTPASALSTAPASPSAAPIAAKPSELVKPAADALAVLSDPFAAPLASPVAEPMAPVVAAPSAASVVPDAPVVPPPSRRGLHPMAYAFIAMAGLFGAVAAYVVFVKAPPAPQVIYVPGSTVVVQAPPNATDTAPPPQADATAAPTDSASPTAKPVAANGGGPSNAGKPTDPKSSATPGSAPAIDMAGFGGTSVQGPSANGPSGSQGSAGGQLSQGEISGVVASNQPVIRRNCWQPALDARAKDGASNARVSAHIVIGPSGSVQSVSAGGGEKDFPGLSSCIASRIRGWKFPASSGSTPVDVPFVFAAQ
jgi:predicted Zn finger-like uncharacterized protein